MKTSSTMRTLVKLPSMPSEITASKVYKPANMARSHLEGDHLIFADDDGFNRALRHGFFLLEVPSYMDFEYGDRFAYHFFEPATEGDLLPYTGFKSCTFPTDYEGYFDRKHDQWENLYIEQKHWSLIPSEVATLGHHMAHIGICILRSVLNHVGIPRSDWELVTSGLSEGQGHQMLAFNHFRSDKATRGSKFHRDSGWVTVLRSTERGLLAYIDDELLAIDPIPGYLIINFGSSMEVLTENLMINVRANVHGVVRTERNGQRDRMSYAMFLDSNLAGNIYQYGPQGPIKVQSVEEFAIQEVSRTYDENNGTL
ncbi:dioxygenase, isopenicillin N synthase [Photorhabdus khanii NC19]|uniref:Dioxygenase, isopenicillin N synthase n=1 Tax=Photorhabdus khanii NC19 TaxID=1004151 RepID=W3V7V7_9GAMM|nr:2OG-Fe(II) oxygenase family protein [Photorhabdus khanii]ETS31927.1 dioxygenase, isopenicillin N synthase [Photorhabdus khanii NC19]